MVLQVTMAVTAGKRLSICSQRTGSVIESMGIRLPLLEVFVLPFPAVDVWCASLAVEPQTLSRGGRDMGKRILASVLWQEILMMRGGPYLDSAARERPVRVVPGVLGRPRLLLGDWEGPCISFSYGHGIMWSALCAESFCCGIDTARAAEFDSGYPLDRAFHEEELRWAELCMGADRQESAAMLWSTKEAVVKALGCGFHRLDPLDLRIVLVESATNGLHSTARVCGRGHDTRQELIPVISFRSRGAWTSVAIVSKESAL